MIEEDMPCFFFFFFVQRWGRIDYSFSWTLGRIDIDITLHSNLMLNKNNTLSYFGQNWQTNLTRKLEK